jgi:hypothetical protein
MACLLAAIKVALGMTNNARFTCYLRISTTNTLTRYHPALKSKEIPCSEYLSPRSLS